jgi:hypothetical protein
VNELGAVSGEVSLVAFAKSHSLFTAFQGQNGAGSRVIGQTGEEESANEGSSFSGLPTQPRLSFPQLSSKPKRESPAIPRRTQINFIPLFAIVPYKELVTWNRESPRAIATGAVIDTNLNALTTPWIDPMISLAWLVLPPVMILKSL